MLYSLPLVELGGKQPIIWPIPIDKDVYIYKATWLQATAA